MAKSGTALARISEVPAVPEKDVGLAFDLNTADLLASHGLAHRRPPRCLSEPPFCEP